METFAPHCTLTNMRGCDRMKLLEAMVEAANSEKKTAESQLAEAQENCKAMEIESTRLKTALEAAKEKVRMEGSYHYHLHS